MPSWEMLRRDDAIVNETQSGQAAMPGNSRFTAVGSFSGFAVESGTDDVHRRCARAAAAMADAGVPPIKFDVVPRPGQTEIAQRQIIEE